MQINTLTPRTKSVKKKRVGRGGTRGKTSGRGHKGQRQHGGHGIRPQMRDEIKRIPKLRGRGVNSNTPVTAKSRGINLSLLETVCTEGMHVTPTSLLALGLIKKQGGLYPKVKILGTGEITKKIRVSKCAVSATAKAKIEKAGGTVK